MNRIIKGLSCKQLKAKFKLISQFSVQAVTKQFRSEKRAIDKARYKWFTKPTGEFPPQATAKQQPSNNQATE